MGRIKNSAVYRSLFVFEKMNQNGIQRRTFQRRYTDFRPRPQVGGWERGRQSRLASLRNRFSRHFSNVELDRYGERLRRFAANRTSPQEWKSYGSMVSIFY